LAEDGQRRGRLESDGSEFQRSDAATGNVRRPTVVSRNDGTSIDVVMTREVGDNQAGRRHEQDRSRLAARDHAECEMP